MTKYDKTIAYISGAVCASLLLHIGGYYILTALSVPSSAAILILFTWPSIILVFRAFWRGEDFGDNVAYLFLGTLFPGIGFLLILEPDGLIDTGRSTSWEMIGTGCWPAETFYLCLLVPWPEDTTVASSVLMALIVLTAQLGALALAPIPLTFAPVEQAEA